MTGYDNIQFSSRKRFRRYLWMLIAIATFIIASILVYVSLMDQRGNRKIAIEEARIHLKTSQAFRYWGVSHGGVYVPTDENTPPSPYLSHIEERDITTPSGIPLTLMNPAYMVRQMHEDLSDIAGVTCRITSLKPLRKENAPDDWERAALQALELDSTEVTEFIEINGNLYLRLMIPMIVEKSCLKCHGDQGYKIGDIRGGVVVSYPMKQILVHEREHINTFIISFGLLWLISIAGIIIGIFYMKRRVDQRDRIQHALQESEERYRKIVESTNACLFSTDNRGRFTFINDGGSKVLGYPQEQLIGRFYLKFIHPEDKKRVHEVYISQLKTGKITTTIEFRYIDSSGRIGWLVFIVNPMIVNGEIVGFNGVAQEITDRKRMEQMQLVTYKIADSVNTTKDIYELFNSIRLELGVIIDTKNFFIALYDEEKDMISLPLFEDEKDSFTEFPAGKTMTSYVVKNDKPLLATYELQLKMVETGKIEAFGTHSKVWLGVPLKSGGKVTGAVVVQSYEDSSAYSNKDLEILQFVSGQIATAIERKQAEEAIQKSEHKYRLLAETAKDVIMVLDLKGYFIYINPEGLKLGGFSEDEAHGMNITDIIPDDQFPFVEEEFARRAAGEGDINVIELEIYNKAKVRIPVEIKSSLIIEDGKPTGVLVFARDITERKLAEQALRESEEKFRSVIQQSNDCIILIDIETLKVIDANPAFGRLLGYTDDEVLNLRAYDYLAHDKDDINRAIQQVLFEQHVYIGERHYIRKDGSTIDMDVNTNYITLGERKVLSIVSRDITERKRLEEEQNRLQIQMQETQKLESLGVLAGGIAHDFNNLLATIIGNASLAQMDISPVSPALESIQQIEKSALHAADLTKQMLAYSGKGKFIVQPVDLSELVREMLHLLKTSISKKAKINIELKENLPATEVDTTQIRQVVMNLITNASEALEDQDGVISLVTDVMYCSQEYLQDAHLPENLKEGEYVYISVTDTGCGMDAETIAKIFDPFYTTKFTGRGLGLAAVLGIVRGHNAAIMISSELGKGSIFTVLLPSAGKPVAKKVVKDVGEIESDRSGVTILVVDDNSSVRQLAVKVLHRSGYDVITAADGKEAVEKFSVNADKINCVLLDLTMPNMSGEEAFRKIRKIRSDTAVVLVSGYGEEKATERFTGKGLKGFIQKPYKPKELTDLLEKIL